MAAEIQIRFGLSSLVVSKPMKSFRLGRADFEGIYSSIPGTFISIQPNSGPSCLTVASSAWRWFSLQT
jgi:hypothetical protein